MFLWKIVAIFSELLSKPHLTEVPHNVINSTINPNYHDVIRKSALHTENNVLLLNIQFYNFTYSI